MQQTMLINTKKKAKDVAPRDSKGNIVSVETSKWPVGKHGSTCTDTKYYTTHKPRTPAQLFELRSQGSPVNIHWWEAANHCTMLLDNDLCNDHEHVRDVSHFRDLAMICHPSKQPANECFQWIHVGRFINVEVENCPECHYLVGKHHLGRHLKKKDVHPKLLNGYCYLRLYGKPVCPVCVKLFPDLRHLQVHMGQYWSDEQMYRLGYKAVTFRNLQLLPT